MNVSLRDRRYPLSPLLEMAHLEIRELAKVVGCPPSQVYRWRRQGIGFTQADRVAVAAGFLPYEVWDDWLEHSAEQIVHAREAADARKRQRKVS